MTQRWGGWYWHLSMTLLAIAASGDCAIAQITPDGTLGAEGSVVVPTNINGVPTQQIDGGAVASANLFHSFDEFSVPTGSAAYFNNAQNIQNIISRVTGSSISNIDGLLKANGTANLFLLNPNGIVFGPNARLNIGGSFLASTASSLNFADGTQFIATANPKTPLLTISVPLGLQFGGTKGDIRVQGSSLGMQPAKTLALVGGNVRLDGGTLLAPGGRVELGGLASSGTVGLVVDGDNLRLSYQEEVQRADVFLTNKARVNVAASGGGSIAVNARSLNVLGESQLFAGIASGLDSVTAQAGDIDLDATGAISVADSIIFNNVASEAVGKGGDINIKARSLELTNDARVAASTFGHGDAGSVSVQVNDSVSLTTSQIFTSVLEGAVGNGGNIDIKARSLELTAKSALVTGTSGHGNAGRVSVQVDDSVSLTNSAIYNNVAREAVGKGGNINIQARSLKLTAKSALSTDTYGHGNAGNILIQASDSVAIINSNISTGNSIGDAELKVAVGNGGDINILTGSLSLSNSSYLGTNSYGQGDAGSVFIRASGSVSFTSGSFITSGVTSSAFIGIAGPLAVGKGGDINIIAQSLTLDDANLNPSTTGQGSAGDIFVHTNDSVSLSNSRITSAVYSGGVGNGGNIDIQTNGSVSLSNSRITSAVYSGGVGNGGNIDIQTNSSVSLSDSVISSSVQPGGVGKGGNIDIQTRSLFLKDGSELEAAVIGERDNLPGGQGQGGNIRINATETVDISGRDANGFYGGLFTSTAGEGNAGDIFVQTNGSISLGDSVISSAVESGGVGKGGNIDIQTRSLFLKEGSELRADVRGERDNLPGGHGQGGNIRINATETTDISGTDADGFSSGLFTSVGLGAIGQAGNIDVTARLIRLDNRGKLKAETASGQGGNITLQAHDLLLLRQNSLISTTAGTAQAGGDGGNITINAGSIVAVTGENSDIFANAYTGKGGRVLLTAEGIFGTQLRDRLTLESDITASSEFGVNGVIDINTPDIDPRQGLVVLPAQLVDTSALIASGCGVSRRQQESKFIVTGRGGLPLRPGDAHISPYPTGSVRSIPSSSPSIDSAISVEGSVPATNATTSEPAPIVEAQGWVFNDKGEIVLTAQPNTATPHNPWMNPATCHG